jgi:hypothetical protein
MDLSDNLVDNSLHTVYIHFTRINNIPYIIATNPSQDVLLFKTELLPVTKEEKKDPSKILFPIALKYYSYVP